MIAPAIISGGEDHGDIVLVDQTLDELPAELKSEFVHFVKGDPCRESSLQRANYADANSVFLLADRDAPAHSDHQNLAVALTIERNYPEVTTVVECLHQENLVFFERAGCDSIVCVRALTQQMLAQELQDPGVHSVVSELTSNRHGRQFYIVDIPKAAKTFQELSRSLSSDTALVLGVKRKDDNYLLPESSFQLELSDKAILIASRRPKQV